MKNTSVISIVGFLALFVVGCDKGGYREVNQYSIE